MLDGDSESTAIAPLCRAIAACGGKLELKTPATRLEWQSDCVRSVQTAQGSAIATDAVVVALDVAGFRAVSEFGFGALLGRLTQPQGGGSRMAPELRLPAGLVSSVLRLWFRRMPERAAAPSGVVAGFPFDNYFWLDRLQAPFCEWHERTGGSVLECHLYAENAERSRCASDGELVARVLDALERVWPELAGALVHSHVLRNPPTHVSFAPGVWSELPGVATSAKNVFLCGDWIGAPFQALYLERACLTGLLAAERVARELAVGLSANARPLPPLPAGRSVRAARRGLRAMRSVPLLPAVV